jgi:Na+/H+ antiporter NhaD/arsenite permease-like protein
VLFVVVAGLSHTGMLQRIVKKIVNIVYPLTPLQ